jgi:beta-lactam-binding protein with PASTA domain
MKIKLPFKLPDVETYDRRFYRPIIIISIVIIALMVVSAFIVFGLTIRGAEQTMVPEVRGMDITTALVEMQEKELYPRIQLRFSQNAADKGIILDQKPSPGTIVKAGRRIYLVVSRGVVLDKIENYVGQDLNEVKIHLQTLLVGNKPLLTVKEPIYVFNKAPVGSILEQKPAPDTEIGGPTELSLVVSRGPQNAELKVPSLVGLSIPEAMAAVERSGVFFECAARKAAGREKPGSVVSQLPEGGSMVVSNSRVEFVIAEPEPSEDRIFGILDETLPEYPYPLALKAEAIYPTGERVSVLSVKHPGGHLTIPYLVPPESSITVTILNKEVFRVAVKAPAPAE